MFIEEGNTLHDHRSKNFNTYMPDEVCAIDYCAKFRPTLTLHIL
jgi:hypothetical protein